MAAGRRVLLSHGGGGLLAAEFIRDHILSRFANPFLDRLDDSAVLPVDRGRLAFTSDSFVVSPAFFPGGNIGDLAVCGTVNDLSMAGARPLWLSLSLILEDGLPLADLDRILDAAAERAEEARVQVVCGDTKVVDRGQADGIFINTAGLGVISRGLEVSASLARPGDRILLSGVVGLHGLAVMLCRGNFQLSTPVESDVAPLWPLVAALIESGIAIHALRDLTRGGLATALSDIAERSSVSMEIREECIPVQEAQASACDILGLDYLHVACEGRFIAIVANDCAEEALAIVRGFPAGRDAALIGSVRSRDRYDLEMVTSIGSRRVVSVPRGEQMPRIC